MNVMKTLKNLLCRIGRRLKVYLKHLYWTPERVHKRGMELIEEINRKRPANSVIVYAGPYMGDVCYMMAFVEEFKRQNPNKKVIVVTFSAFAKSLVESYTGFDKVVLLTKRQSRLFEMLSNDFEVAKLARESAVYNAPMDVAYSTQYPTVLDRLRHMFFAVGDQAPIRYHGLSPERVTCIPGFYESCNRIIVLNPYSNSSHISKKNFVYLERLVDHLVNDGNAGGGIPSIPM